MQARCTKFQIPCSRRSSKLDGRDMLEAETNHTCSLRVTCLRSVLCAGTDDGGGGYRHRRSCGRSEHGTLGVEIYSSKYDEDFKVVLL